MEAGEIGLKFNRFSGLSDKTYIEGLHILIPWVEVPINFRTKLKYHDVTAATPNRDLQLITLKAQVVFKPDKTRLHTIYEQLGMNYDKKVLNTIVSEVVRSVVSQFDAQQLNVGRNQISNQMRFALQQRVYPYGIIVDEFAIASLSFTPEYQKAVEQKQIAIQQALEAKYQVDQARQQKKSIIIQAQADAESIELIGKSAAKNPCKIRFDD